MDRGKKKRGNDESNATTQIAPYDPVKKETEDEFLGHWRDGSREQDDNDALLD